MGILVLIELFFVFILGLTCFYFESNHSHSGTPQISEGTLTRLSVGGRSVYEFVVNFLNAYLSEFHLRHVGLLWGFWCHLLANIWFNFEFMSWVFYGHFLYLWNFNLFQPKWMMFLMKLIMILVSTSRPRRQHFFFWQLVVTVESLVCWDMRVKAGSLLTFFFHQSVNAKECNETWSELMWPVRINYYFSLSFHHSFHVRRVHGDRSLSAQHTS